MIMTRNQLELTVDQFAEENLGQALDQDDSWGSQCTEVYREWCMETYGLDYFQTGNGWQLPERSRYDWASYFDKLPAGTRPLKGDWIVWGQGWSNNGHVALVTEEPISEWVTVFEQDGSQNRYRKIRQPDGTIKRKVIKYAKCKYANRSWQHPAITCVLRPILTDTRARPGDVVDLAPGAPGVVTKKVYPATRPDPIPESVPGNLERYQAYGLGITANAVPAQPPMNVMSKTEDRVRRWIKAAAMALIPGYLGKGQFGGLEEHLGHTNKAAVVLEVGAVVVIISVFLLIGWMAYRDVKNNPNPSKVSIFFYNIFKSKLKEAQKWANNSISG